MAAKPGDDGADRPGNPSTQGPHGAALEAQDQSAAIGFLAAPASYPPGVGAVERIDTHAAMVFLAGEEAYKIKRAVRYPYLDFSSLDRREAVLRRELELNRRTAPRLYLEVLPICRDGAGRLSFAGKGVVVEWVLRMRRFPQEALFDRMAQAGSLTADLCRRLADRVAEFHRAAQPGEDHGPGAGRAAQAWVLEENIAELETHKDIFPPARVAELSDLSRAWLERLTPLLDRRAESGLLRLCHGDLHLGNICLSDGEPTLFDCIEFSDRIATVDVLYDLAFLLMDLDNHGLPEQANIVMNRYLQCSGGEEGLAALPFFLSQRAAVRAQVGATAAACQPDAAKRDTLYAAARRSFDLALDFLSPAVPVLVAVGGFSGSGKTSLARRLAPHLGAVPGALHVRSDVLRKALSGKDELYRLPPEAYGRGSSARVYAEMLALAERVLDAGQAVVLDAVYARPEERAAAESLAAKLRVSFYGFWLEAPEGVLAARIEGRRGDASDATPAVVASQLKRGAGPIAWRRLDAGGSGAAVGQAALHDLREQGALVPRHQPASQED